jgi:hypothetical protein
LRTGLLVAEKRWIGKFFPNHQSKSPKKSNFSRKKADLHGHENGVT